MPTTDWHGTVKKVKRVCKHCGVEFIAVKHNHVFCSRSCQVLHLSVHTECKYCGKKYKGKPRSVNYCSTCYKNKDLPIKRREQKGQSYSGLNPDPDRQLIAAILLCAVNDLRNRGCLDAFEWLHYDGVLYAEALELETDIKAFANNTLKAYNSNVAKRIWVKRYDDHVRIAVS